MSRIAGYLTDHWRGKHSFLRVILFNLPGVCLALSVLGRHLPDNPPLIIGFLVFTTVVLIWQLTGAMRRADASLAEQGGLIQAGALFGVGLGVVFVSAVQGMDLVVEHLLPAPPREPPKQLELEISADGQQVFVSGEIDFPKNTALQDALAAQPGLRELVLDSTGGSVFAARAMAIHIGAAGLDTRVDGLCFSACTLIFMAGQTRRLSKEARLGFHGYRFDKKNRVQTVEVNQEEQKDRVYLHERGVGEEFVNRIFATSPDRIWIPDTRALQQSGVLNAPRD